MAEPVSLTLLASGVRTASGSGDAVSVTGRQRVARFTVDVSAYSGFTSVLVSLQQRVDTSAQWETTSTATVTGVTSAKLDGEIGPLTRVIWTVTGSGSITFGVRGTGHTVYAKPSDFGRVVKVAGIAEMTATQKIDAAIAASDEADGYLAGCYTLPIVSWTEVLTDKTAALAVAKLFNARGFESLNSPDAIVIAERDNAQRWFDRLQSGRTAPGIVDSTPEVFNAGIAIASRPRRRW